MHPVCFEILGRPIYWYGVFVALGFLLAVTNWNLLARWDGRPAGFGSELGFWVMLTGLIGARLAYVLSNPDYYFDRPLEIIRIDRGGLVFYGGLVGGFTGMLFFARARRMPWLAAADFAATGLLLGHAVGRIGCFLNGCCFGTVHHGWPHVVFPPHSPASVEQTYAGLLTHDGLPSLPVHPTQLYETAYNLLIYAILIGVYLRRGRRAGVVAALYLMLYSIGRFGIEFLRGDERLQWLGLNVAQIVGLVLCAAGLGILVATRRRREARPPAA